jgi:hypothetical protein
MKNYIIIGDNNYWYSTFDAKFAHEVTEQIELVKAGIKDNLYEINTANKLYIYETKLITEINL